jgi:Ca2+-binding RTX toxin-like protein
MVPLFTDNFQLLRNLAPALPFQLNRLTGTATADLLTGFADLNLIFGEGGDDTLLGYDGYDRLFGGDGADRLEGRRGWDVLHGGMDNDLLFGGGGSDTIDGGDGGDGNDTVYAGAGDDLIVDIHSEGLIYLWDVYDGGAGIDTFRHDLTWSSSVSFNLLTGFASHSGSNYDSFANIENLEIGGLASIIGNHRDNVLTALSTNSSYGNVMAGNGGNDTLDGRGGDDRMYGGGGQDWLEGGEGDDSLTGGAGDDTIRGGNGYDVAIFKVNYADASIVVNTDSITVTSAQGVDVLFDVELLKFLDQTVRMSIHDVLTGTKEDDTLDGLEGNDFINGLSGNDSLLSGDGMDTLWGGDGNDTLKGGRDNDTLAGGHERDWLEGNEGADVLSGGLGSDSLFGGEGNDTLYGDDGGDLLRGGTGDDELRGDDGADVFVFSAGDGADTVNDSFYNSGSEDKFRFVRTTVDQVYRSGDDVIIEYGSGDSITLADWSYDIADLVFEFV